MYALILVAPNAGTHASLTPLHSTFSSLATAIAAVEASYADVSAQITDRHLGLPASARFCRHLTLSLPATGHARLACELRPAAGVHGTLVLLRSPQGAWRCVAHVSHPHLLPAACSPSSSE
ncbi:pilin [Stenotrophomonas sp. NPDC077659]|uniref:pilin n=1 Tax=Stenotrophomonas sp. NPDC077659 TaxID=3390694 RepID=UPI003D053F95